MARRGRNIYKRKDNRWEGRIVLGYNESGKRKYRSVYGKTYGEAKEKIQEYTEKFGNKRGNGKTIEFILYYWLEQKKKRWKSSTYANYRKIVENHLIPFWADIHPEILKLEDIKKFVLTKENDGLSYKYIKKIYGLLLQALKYYESENENIHYKIPAFSFSGMTDCISERKSLPSLETIKEIEQTLYLNETPEQAGLLIAINSGIRIGELCALQWKDIDLRNGIVHINKTMQRIKTYDGKNTKTEVCILKPKSNTSIRDIPLPSNLVSFLFYKKGKPEEYIVPGKKVRFCEPRTLQYRFERFLQQNDLEGFHFHALRHCFASRCVELGFDAKSLCEIMGHSDIQVTLRLYVHTSLKQKRILMERLNQECKNL